MRIKNSIKILVLIVGLMVVVLLSVACFSNNSNEIKIKGR